MYGSATFHLLDSSESTVRIFTKEMQLNEEKWPAKVHCSYIYCFKLYSVTRIFDFSQKLRPVREMAGQFREMDEIWDLALTYISENKPNTICMKYCYTQVNNIICLFPSTFVSFSTVFTILQ